MAEACEYTEAHHTVRWWGTQKCRKCNPEGLPVKETAPCTDCPGDGWTMYAALANEPWSHIHEGLWMGACDYNPTTGPDARNWAKAEVTDDAPFDVVVSVFSGAWPELYGPPEGSRIEHHMYPFLDSPEVTPEVLKYAFDAAMRVNDELAAGKRVMVRCQAGLNRSGLVAGLVLVSLFGFTPEEAVMTLRERRSVWALCNEAFENFLLSMSNEGTQDV